MDIYSITSHQSKREIEKGGGDLCVEDLIHIYIYLVGTKAPCFCPSIYNIFDDCLTTDHTISIWRQWIHLNRLRTRMNPLSKKKENDHHVVKYFFFFSFSFLWWCVIIVKILLMMFSHSFFFFRVCVSVSTFCLETHFYFIFSKCLSPISVLRFSRHWIL